jgi:hypothetical protein
MALLTCVVGLTALSVASPTLVRLLQAAVPLVLVAGLLAVVWRVTNYLTRR